MTSRYVALLRGINVGGNNKIAMAELRTCFSDGGYADVSTYINSGNVFLTAPRRPTPESLEALISDHFDLQIAVLVRSRDEVAEVIAQAPQEFADPNLRADVWFLREGTTAEAARDALPTPHPEADRIWTGPGVVYTTRVAALATKSRLGRVAGTPLYREVSVRNWNTTRKLLTLLDG